MEKHILMLTIEDALACMNLQQKKKLIVTNVTNKSEIRLSRSRGNVNMTDFWIELINEFRNHDMCYTTQHISLLRDGKEDWWSKLHAENTKDNIWIAFAFIKTGLSNDKSQSYQQLKELLDNENVSAAVYYTFGNADFIIVLKDKSAFSLKEKLKKLKEYENLYSYYDAIGKLEKADNKNWEISFKETSYSIENKENTLYKAGKCWEIIEKLRSKIEDNELLANKKMVSYYHALLQVMNIMIQYEHSEKKEDFYYMFYPPIRLFFEQLSTALEKADELEKAMKVESDSLKKSKMLIWLNTLKCKIEQSFSAFLDDLEVQFHHIGYSCRDVVIDSGRGGLPYDIPIKICKIYIIYLNMLSVLLNDKKGYEYQYCLAPLAYSRPTTGIFDMGLSSERRLIEIQISRSMMYMPRSLMVILAHEVSHYVGTDTRARDLRNSQYLKIVALTITESMFDPVKIKEFTEITQKYIENLKENVYTYFIEGLCTNYQILFEKNVNDYGSEMSEEELSHFRYFRENVTKALLRLIEDPDGRLHSLFYTIDDRTKERILLSNEKKKIMQEITLFQQSTFHELCLVGLKQEPWNFIELFAKAITEMFADLCAVKVLDLDLDDLIEAYVISEGMSLDVEQIPTILINRIAIVTIVMRQNGERKWLHLNNNVEELDMLGDCSKSSEFRKKLKEEVFQYIQEFESVLDEEITYNDNEVETERDFFYCVDIKEAEEDYLTYCYHMVKTQLNSSKENKFLLDKVRNLYRCFGNYALGEREGFSYFFEICQQSEEWYKEHSMKSEA